jgi:hypothetical protein
MDAEGFQEVQHRMNIRRTIFNSHKIDFGTNHFEQKMKTMSSTLKTNLTPYDMNH